MAPARMASAGNTIGQGDVVDAVFAITCRSLPVDHAWALAQAVGNALPWFSAEPDTGLHTVHGATSGSGWMRPEGAGALLQLSHRAKLTLRLPRHRVEDAAALLGHTLDVAGWPLHVDRLAVRPLSRITTLHAHSVVFAGSGADDEMAFVSAAEDELRTRGIVPVTLLCGRATPVVTPAHVYQTRSLMLAGLTRAQSLVLQQRGLGVERRLGCGVFIPHKDIGDLNSRPDR